LLYDSPRQLALKHREVVCRRFAAFSISGPVSCHVVSMDMWMSCKLCTIPIVRGGHFRPAAPIRDCRSVCLWQNSSSSEGSNYTTAPPSDAPDAPTRSTTNNAFTSSRLNDRTTQMLSINTARNNHRGEPDSLDDVCAKGRGERKICMRPSEKSDDTLITNNRVAKMHVTNESKVRPSICTTPVPP